MAQPKLATKSYYENAYNKGVGQEARFADVEAIFRSLKGGKLLDVGCGDGAFTTVLAKAMNAQEAFGIELSKDGVRSARSKGIDAIEQDINLEPLPFVDGFFDVVFLGEIIEHVFDPDRLLGEANRVLRPGGTCVLSTPNLAGWPNRISLLFGYQPFPTAASPNHESAGKLLLKEPQGMWGHIRVMTLRALMELVSYHGFQIVEMKGSTATPKTTRFLFSVLRIIDRTMSHFPSLASRVILVLNKAT